MTEEDFLNVVLQAAGSHPLDKSGMPSELDKSWNSEAQWEIAAQVQIDFHLKRLGIVAKIREIRYPQPYQADTVDFAFIDAGETYAVELKVESQNGRFAGMSLQEAVTRDVNKLHGFKANHRWVVIIAVSQKNRELLAKALDRGDSWLADNEGRFTAYLCNIDTYPHGLPFERYGELDAPFQFL
jgi:hypothetical protein